MRDYELFIIVMHIFNSKELLKFHCGVCPLSMDLFDTTRCSPLQ